METFKEFLNDNSGGLILPFSGKTIPDEEWLEYKKLGVDKSVKSINHEDFPSDFCDAACRLVNEFRRKTVNEKVEWMLYFDYITGDVIYCWKGNEGKSGGDFDRIHFQNRKIASVHSHPRGYYSFPSPENFDILENEFEDYEIITSCNAIWIVEFKGVVEKSIRNNFQYLLGEEIDEMIYRIRLDYDIDYIDNITESIVSNYLLCSIDKKINGVELILIKKEFD